LAVCIYDIHRERPVQIRQEPDIEAARIRIGPDTYRIGEDIMTLNTIINRDVHR